MPWPQRQQKTRSPHLKNHPYRHAIILRGSTPQCNKSQPGNRLTRNTPQHPCLPASPEPAPVPRGTIQTDPAPCRLAPTRHVFVALDAAPSEEPEESATPKPPSRQPTFTMNQPLKSRHHPILQTAHHPAIVLPSARRDRCPSAPSLVPAPRQCHNFHASPTLSSRHHLTAALCLTPAPAHVCPLCPAFHVEPVTDKSPHTPLNRPQNRTHPPAV